MTSQQIVARNAASRVARDDMTAALQEGVEQLISQQSLIGTAAGAELRALVYGETKEDA